MTAYWNWSDNLVGYGALRGGKEEEDGSGAAKVKGGEEGSARGNTGTWFGPAPKGKGNAGLHDPQGGLVRQPPAYVVKSERLAKDILTSSGMRVPVCGLEARNAAEAMVVEVGGAVGEGGDFHVHVTLGREEEGGLPVAAAKEVISAFDKKRRDVLFSVTAWGKGGEAAAAVEYSCGPAEGGIVRIAMLGLNAMWSTEEAVQEWDDFSEKLNLSPSLVLGIESAGSSPLPPPMLLALLEGTTRPPCLLRTEMHPLLPQRMLLGLCLRRGILAMAKAPLYPPPSSSATTEGEGDGAIESVAARVGGDTTSVLLRWCAGRGVPFTLLEHQYRKVKEEEGVLEWSLPPAEKACIDALCRR